MVAAGRRKELPASQIHHSCVTKATSAVATNEAAGIPHRKRRYVLVGDGEGGHLGTKPLLLKQTEQLVNSNMKPRNQLRSVISTHRHTNRNQQNKGVRHDISVSRGRKGR